MLPVLDGNAFLLAIPFNIQKTIMFNVTDRDESQNIASQQVRIHCNSNLLNCKKCISVTSWRHLRGVVLALCSSSCVECMGQDLMRCLLPFSC